MSLKHVNINRRHKTDIEIPLVTRTGPRHDFKSSLQLKQKLPKRLDESTLPLDEPYSNSNIFISNMNINLNLNINISIPPSPRSTRNNNGSFTGEEAEVKRGTEDLSLVDDEMPIHSGKLRETVKPETQRVLQGLLHNFIQPEIYKSL
jgi:hypothetical protein